MALKDYNGNYFNYINDLINGGEDDSKDGYLNIENFNSISHDGLKMEDFWEQLLKYLSTEIQQEACSGEGGIIRDTDFGEHLKETVVEYINNKIDLDHYNTENSYLEKGEELEDVLSYINNYISQLPEGESHWNESLGGLVDFYLKNFIGQGEEDPIELNKEGTIKNSHGAIPNGINESTAFRIDDLINADAGNYFGTADLDDSPAFNYSKQSDPEIKNEDGTLNQLKTYVRPWFNIDGDSYLTVRSRDRFEQILNSNKNLQFTRFRENEEDYLKESGDGLALLERYIRLIMPMYQRTVEIEDLNRNFWVIGQVLSGLCSYLFDDDSPFVKMFQGLLDEIIQLWENVAFLWAIMALNSNKKYTDIQAIFMPVSLKEDIIYSPYNKFDNFALIDEDEDKYSYGSSGYIVSKNKTILEESWGRMEYLKDKYDKSNLVIVPEVRLGNYMKNYYYRALYPGIIMYNRYSDTVSYIPSNTAGIDLSSSKDLHGQIILTEDINSFIDYENNYYFNVDDDWNTDNGDINGDKIYGVRTLFKCNFQMNEEETDFSISNIYFQFYDLGRILCGYPYDSSLIAEYINTEDTFDAENSYNNLNLTYQYNSDSETIVNNSFCQITRGYYLGEITSWMGEAVIKEKPSSGGSDPKDTEDNSPSATDEEGTVIYPNIDFSLDGYLIYSGDNNEETEKIYTYFDDLGNVQKGGDFSPLEDVRFYVMYYAEAQTQKGLYTLFHNGISEEDTTNSSILGAITEKWKAGIEESSDTYLDSYPHIFWFSDSDSIYLQRAIIQINYVYFNRVIEDSGTLDDLSVDNANRMLQGVGEYLDVNSGVLLGRELYEFEDYLKAEYKNDSPYKCIYIEDSTNGEEVFSGIKFNMDRSSSAETFSTAKIMGEYFKDFLKEKKEISLDPLIRPQKQEVLPIKS